MHSSFGFYGCDFDTSSIPQKHCVNISGTLAAAV